jgi:hypothetical protein
LGLDRFHAEFPSIKERAGNPEIALPVTNYGFDCLIDFFQIHTALALAGLGGNRVAHTGAAAVTKIDTFPGQIDPFDRLTATALGRILGIQATGATLIALAKEDLITLTLQNMAPLHGFAAFTVAGGGADRIAFALVTAGAGVKHILAGLGSGQGLFGGKAGKQHQQTTTD